MKVMVASIFLFLGTVLLPALTAISFPECPLWSGICNLESVTDECGPNRPCPGGRQCCSQCGMKCVGPSAPVSFLECPLWKGPCEWESIIDECEPNLPCPSGQLCCSQCGWKCVGPIVTETE